MPKFDLEEPTLQRDLQALAAMPGRRRVLAWMANAACFSLVACVTKQADSGGDDSSTDDGPGESADGTCSPIPEETAGPFPGDGSNGVNALALADIVRSDIRTSIGTASGTAEGLPLLLRLTIVAPGCAPLAGYAVYVWHCDRDGLYSMYTLPDQNYLRGVQVTDANGEVTFTSIFPACYPGRWPHIHVEVYASLEAISSASNAVATSQMALPAAECEEVYATTGYETSAESFPDVSLETDGAFNDGAEDETPSLSGDATEGYTATMQVCVRAV